MSLIYSFYMLEHITDVQIKYYRDFLLEYWLQAYHEETGFAGVLFGWEYFPGLVCSAGPRSSIGVSVIIRPSRLAENNSSTQFKNVKN